MCAARRMLNSGWPGRRSISGLIENPDVRGVPGLEGVLRFPHRLPQPVVAAAEEQQGIQRAVRPVHGEHAPKEEVVVAAVQHAVEDRKSTRLNSSHQIISYAVFCLKK